MQIICHTLLSASPDRGARCKELFPGEYTANVPLLNVPIPDKTLCASFAADLVAESGCEIITSQQDLEDVYGSLLALLAAPRALASHAVLSLSTVLETNKRAKADSGAEHNGLREASSDDGKDTVTHTGTASRANTQTQGTPIQTPETLNTSERANAVSPKGTQAAAHSLPMLSDTQVALASFLIAEIGNGEDWQIQQSGVDFSVDEEACEALVNSGKQRDSFLRHFSLLAVNELLESGALAGRLVHLRGWLNGVLNVPQEGEHENALLAFDRYLLKAQSGAGGAHLEQPRQRGESGELLDSLVPLTRSDYHLARVAEIRSKRLRASRGTDQQGARPERIPENVAMRSPRRLFERKLYKYFREASAASLDKHKSFFITALARCGARGSVLSALLVETPHTDTLRTEIIAKAVLILLRVGDGEAVAEALLDTLDKWQGGNTLHRADSLADEHRKKKACYLRLFMEYYAGHQITPPLAVMTHAIAETELDVEHPQCSTARRSSALLAAAWKRWENGGDVALAQDNGDDELSRLSQLLANSSALLSGPHFNGAERGGRDKRVEKKIREEWKEVKCAVTFEERCDDGIIQATRICAVMCTQMHEHIARTQRRKIALRKRRQSLSLAPLPS